MARAAVDEHVGDQRPKVSCSKFLSTDTTIQDDRIKRVRGELQQKDGRDGDHDPRVR